MDEEEIKEKATMEIKSKKKELIQKFAGEDFPKVDLPVSIYMAGSPGAGKTEFSIRFIEMFESGTLSRYLSDDQQIIFTKIVRIDPDEIRNMISDYTGSNAYLFQGAVSKGVALLLDHCHTKSKSYVLDGTLSKFHIAKGNIERSINAKRPVTICYVYQEPVQAWKFTQEREKIEGRRITKEVFVEEFFSARDSVVELKKLFGNQIQVWIVKRNFLNNTYRIDINVDNIDTAIKNPYSKDDLLQKL